eukprot:Nk52_evm14s2325 gene=Nk52_evmTU14s2325
MVEKQSSFTEPKQPVVINSSLRLYENGRTEEEEGALVRRGPNSDSISRQDDKCEGVSSLLQPASGVAVVRINNKEDKYHRKGGMKEELSSSSYSSSSPLAQQPLKTKRNNNMLYVSVNRLNGGGEEEGGVCGRCCGVTCSQCCCCPVLSVRNFKILVLFCLLMLVGLFGYWNYVLKPGGAKGAERSVGDVLGDKSLDIYVNYTFSEKINDEFLKDKQQKTGEEGEKGDVETKEGGEDDDSDSEKENKEGGDNVDEPQRFSCFLEQTCERKFLKHPDLKHEWRCGYVSTDDRGGESKEKESAVLEGKKGEQEFLCSGWEYAKAFSLTEPSGRWLVTCNKPCAEIKRPKDDHEGRYHSEMCDWSSATYQRLRGGVIAGTGDGTPKQKACAARPVIKKDVHSCLKGRTFVFVGDSTLRGIMNGVLDRGQLKPTPTAHHDFYILRNSQNDVAVYFEYFSNANTLELGDSIEFLLDKIPEKMLQKPREVVLVVGGITMTPEMVENLHDWLGEKTLFFAGQSVVKKDEMEPAVEKVDKVDSDEMPVISVEDNTTSQKNASSTQGNGGEAKEESIDAMIKEAIETAKYFDEGDDPPMKKTTSVTKITKVNATEASLSASNSTLEAQSGDADEDDFDFDKILDNFFPERASVFDSRNSSNIKMSDRIVTDDIGKRNDTNEKGATYVLEDTSEHPKRGKTTDSVDTELDIAVEKALKEESGVEEPVNEGAVVRKDNLSRLLKKQKFMEGIEDGQDKNGEGSPKDEVDKEKREGEADDMDENESVDSSGTQERVVNQTQEEDADMRKQGGVHEGDEVQDSQEEEEEIEKKLERELAMQIQELNLEDSLGKDGEENSDGLKSVDPLVRERRAPKRETYSQQQERIKRERLAWKKSQNTSKLFDYNFRVIVKSRGFQAPYDNFEYMRANRVGVVKAGVKSEKSGMMYLDTFNPTMSSYFLAAKDHCNCHFNSNNPKAAPGERIKGIVNDELVKDLFMLMCAE